MTEIPDGTHTAVLDRFEDTERSRVAVLVVEGEERPLGDLLVDPEDLPEAARHPDAVLRVTVEDGAPRSLSYEAAETTERRADAQSRFDCLADRPPDDDGE
jgi:hypothetical protein